MQDLWIFYSLAWLIALWLWDYIKKLILSKWGNKELFLITCFWVYVPVFIINSFIQWAWEFPIELIKHWIIVWLTDFCIPLGMLTALKYLNISFALVSIRLVSSFVLLFIGTMYLWDSLSLANILWFLLWAIAIFLLSWFKIWSVWKMHHKWLIAMWICTLWIIVSHAYLKYVITDVNIHDFMAVKFFVTFLCISLYIVFRKKYKDFKISDFKLSLPYACITWVLFVLHFLYFLPNMYLLWPLSLSYKILSYSLIVPILLSVVFLWEKVDKKKIIAFILTIISIALFV